MFLLFILFTSQIIGILSDLTEEANYINQLKEPAKKEFVERVIRRIAAEIDLKHYIPTGDSKNISDVQLEEHSDYVKKIINEEKVSFEKKGVNVSDVPNKEILIESRRLLNQSHIDYTLRVKREDRNENSEQNTDKKTNAVEKSKTNERSELNPVHQSPDEKDDIQVKGLKPKSRRSIQVVKENNVKSDIQITSENSKIIDDSDNHSDKLVAKVNETNVEVTYPVTESSIEIKPTGKNTLENRNVEYSDKQAQGIDAKSNKNKVDKVEATIDNGELTDQNKVLNESKLRTSNSKDSSSITAKAEVNEKIGNENGKENFALRSNADNEDKSQTATENPALFEDKSEVKNIVKPAIETKNVKPVNNNTQIDSKTELMETTTLKAPLMAKKLKSIDNANQKTKTKDMLRDPRYSFRPLVKTSNNESEVEKENTKKVVSVLNNKNNGRSKTTVINKNKTAEIEDLVNGRGAKEIDDEIKTLQIAEDVVKALRMGIDRDPKNKRTKINRNKSNSNRKRVHIYGLREDSVQLKTQVRNLEQPYYAPVYNFHPENAYYNAYNKFGPNYEDYGENKELEEKYKPIVPADLSDVSSENYYRSIFKKNRTKLKRKPVTVYNEPYSYNILPYVVNKPYKPPPQEYDELYKNDYVREKNMLRTGKTVDESEESLKNRLKDIRQSIYNDKDTRNENKKEKNVRVSGDKGWLDGDVKYYAAKKERPDKKHQNVYYDKFDNSKFHDSDKKLVKQLVNDISKFLTVSNKINTSREVVTRVKKEKSSKIPYKIQKVFPLLKNIVKIADIGEDKEVAACVKVMGDLVHRNDEGLVHYDWLESTVNIQSAIEKLLTLTRAALEDLEMHPSDVELLKYTAYLYSLAANDLTYTDPPPDLRVMKSRLPKSKKGPHLVKEKGLIANRIWLYRVPDPDKDYKFDYKGLRRFLSDLSDNLYDLHEALKYVSSVTLFRSQHWYKNLKDLYIHDPDKKKLLEVILHLGTTRLFNLIEDSGKKGIEEDFLRYIHENQEEVALIKDAFVFVLKVMQAVLDNKLSY